MYYEHARHEYFKKLSEKLTQHSIPFINHGVLMGLPKEMAQESINLAAESTDWANKITSYDFVKWLNEKNFPRSVSEPLLYEWHTDQARDKVWKLMSPKFNVDDLLLVKKKSFKQRIKELFL